ncbi:EscU/YscU/HrcU family type III secretion system export apparatus switch protein [Oligoflexus tunisiensis]|uniref:EscU/YscU/HrcU family type III secretion system export apparatus switch protein n=1 Tax=Oligoflexus tunisiensis TaxID=708132 RepID=UPI000A4120E1|nr:EscU/YscU/HrcU family type III secretion system export apparatus switch protein [Oligoflexus tunisiensis]
MAAEDEGQDRSEEASPERRDEFRERGQIAVSREVTSVLILAAVVGSFGYYLMWLMHRLQHFLIAHFQHLETKLVTTKSITAYSGEIGRELLIMITPIFVVTTVASMAVTFAQTRLNWSWKKLEPDFSRMNPLKGIAKIFSMDSVMELLKSVGKMVIVGSMTYTILRGEWVKVPGLLHMSYLQAWAYWTAITKTLIWSVVGLLLFLGAADFIYNFFSLEKKMKMTKQEVKDEYKKRELDPHVKARMKRMQREMSSAKTIQATRTATAVITNPTHFAVAIFYELGMGAPVVVAKGKDLLAKQMKEGAKESDIPIIENKPLARTLYKICKVGQEIPESLYKAVSEVIRYVFLLKGKKLSRKP